MLSEAGDIVNEARGMMPAAALGGPPKRDTSDQGTGGRRHRNGTVLLSIWTNALVLPAREPTD